MMYIKNDWKVCSQTEQGLVKNKFGVETKGQFDGNHKTCWKGVKWTKPEASNMVNEWKTKVMKWFGIKLKWEKARKGILKGKVQEMTMWKAFQL